MSPETEIPAVAEVSTQILMFDSFYRMVSAPELFGGPLQSYLAHAFNMFGLACYLESTPHFDPGTQAKSKSIRLPEHGEHAAVIHASI